MLQPFQSNFVDHIEYSSPVSSKTTEELMSKYSRYFAELFHEHNAIKSTQCIIQKLCMKSE